MITSRDCWNSTNSRQLHKDLFLKCLSHVFFCSPFSTIRYYRLNGIWICLCLFCLNSELGFGSKRVSLWPPSPRFKCVASAWLKDPGNGYKGVPWLVPEGRVGLRLVMGHHIKNVWYLVHIFNFMLVWLKCNILRNDFSSLKAPQQARMSACPQSS